MTEIMERMRDVTNLCVRMRCPVLSGNMKHHIRLINASDNSITIMITAPFYDTNEFRKNGKIVYNHKNYNGYTNYAYWVNKVGAFGTHNSSMGWLDRACIEAVGIVCNEFHATPDIKL